MYLLMLLLLSLYITMEQFSRSAGYTQKPIIILLLVDGGAVGAAARDSLIFALCPKSALSSGCRRSLSLVVYTADANFTIVDFRSILHPLHIILTNKQQQRACLHCSMAFNYYWHKMDECNCVIKQYNGSAAASVCAFERRILCWALFLFTRPLPENNHGSMQPRVCQSVLPARMLSVPLFGST